MRRILLWLAVSIVFHVVATNAQTSHTVALSWTQSSGTAVSANKVYRSTASGSQGTAIYTSTVPIVSYVDKGPLTDGATYYYCVTALSSTNNESTCSKQVSAAIPAAPPTPTAISVTIN